MDRHRLAVVLLLVLLVSIAGAQAPVTISPDAAKQPAHRQPPPPDPDVIRQGGDTIADAIDLPFWTEVTGTTVGYTDDYDEVCPYSQSTSPDVVYRLRSSYGTHVDIDMYGSSYDTKIYVYDQDLELVACNDDFYPDYVSRLEAVPLYPDLDYYLVIDGYGGDAGAYVVRVDPIGHWCDLEPEPGWAMEQEPPLEDGYLDDYNSGCNGAQFGYPFGVLLADTDFFGVSGWYELDGDLLRDTDWYVHHLSPEGSRILTVDAEEISVVWLIWPQDCGDVIEWFERVEVGPCVEQELVVTGEPGQEVWVVVAPADWAGDGEFDYTIRLEPHDTVVSEQHSWSSVKGLFR